MFNVVYRFSTSTSNLGFSGRPVWVALAFHFAVSMFRYRQTGFSRETDRGIWPQGGWLRWAASPHFQRLFINLCSLCYFVMTVKVFPSPSPSSSSASPPPQPSSPLPAPPSGCPWSSWYILYIRSYIVMAKLPHQHPACDLDWPGHWSRRSQTSCRGGQSYYRWPDVGPNVSGS